MSVLCDILHNKPTLLGVPVAKGAGPDADQPPTSSDVIFFL
jgi:hypothetical protein